MTDLLDLIPHRGPMLWLDAIELFDAEKKSLTATVTIRADHIFFSEDGVPNWCAIEFMAQAAAALAGCDDRAKFPNQPARPGLLLGTRRLTLNLAKFALGATYRVTATSEFNDADAAAFACTICDADGQMVASATLNAYRPPKFAAFLKEQVGV